MKAVVIRRQSDPRLLIENVEEPVAGEHEAVVSVSHIALNPGELRSMLGARNGARIGWDFVGKVEAAAANTAGPQPGQRVVGTLSHGAWAERVAAPIHSIVLLDERLEPELAVCLPIPGLSAYGALRDGGLLFGKRVLIVGANGAVGQYASQIAVLSGAHVTATVRDPKDERTVRSHGVADVRVTHGLSDLGQPRFDLIIDSVGGSMAGPAISLLAEKGRYVVISPVGGETLGLPFMQLFDSSANVRAMNVFSDAEQHGETKAEILRRLVVAAATGAITVPIGTVSDWSDIDDVARGFINGRNRDKTVLRVNS